MKQHEGMAIVREMERLRVKLAICDLTEKEADQLHTAYVNQTGPGAAGIVRVSAERYAVLVYKLQAAQAGEVR